MLTVSPTPWGFVHIYGNREPRDAPGEKGRTHTPWVWVLGSAANGLLKIQPISPDGPVEKPTGRRGRAHCGRSRRKTNSALRRGSLRFPSGGVDENIHLHFL